MHYIQHSNSIIHRKMNNFKILLLLLLLNKFISITEKYFPNRKEFLIGELN